MWNITVTNYYLVLFIDWGFLKLGMASSILNTAVPCLDISILHQRSARYLFRFLLKRTPMKPEALVDLTFRFLFCHFHTSTQSSKSLQVTFSRSGSYPNIREYMYEILDYRVRIFGVCMWWLGSINFQSNTHVYIIFSPPHTCLTSLIRHQGPNNHWQGAFGGLYIQKLCKRRLLVVSHHGCLWW